MTHYFIQDSVILLTTYYLLRIFKCLFDVQESKDYFTYFGAKYVSDNKVMSMRKVSILISVAT